MQVEAMSRKDLTILAAKAGEIPGEWDEMLGVLGSWNGDDGTRNGYIWDPLFDNGDALALAVKLQLNVHNEHIKAGAAYCTRIESDFDETFYPAVFSGESQSKVIPEDYSATRRAIVLAAARIAQQMTA